MRELDLTDEPKKKKSSKKDEEEPISVPFLVYLKGFFLLVVILFGMFILNSVAQRQKYTKEKSSHKLTFSPGDFAKNINKDAILETAQKEATTNVYYNKAVEGIEAGRDKVLGEASRAATKATEKAKKSIFDYLYEHTLGAVMQDLIQKMPEDQKKRLIEKVSE